MMNDLTLWPIVFLLAWTVVSISLVLRTRKLTHRNGPMALDPVATDEISTFQKPVPIVAEKRSGNRRSNNRELRPYSNLTMAIFLLFPCAILVLIHFRLVTAITDHFQSPGRPLQARGSSVLQEVFQVYRPISFNTEETGGCDLEILLMDHAFASSYGKPYVGEYIPPTCDFDTVRINLTVTSRGRQFDRLALMYLGDVEVFRTSTAEPTATGITWTYIKEMSQYNVLWREPQRLIFDMGNIINDVYTASFNVTLTAHFSWQGNVNVRTADHILPISARKSTSSSGSAFSIPSDNAIVRYRIPETASRVVVAISACGQSEEEFWWSNVFSNDTETFNTTVGHMNAYSPFREIQLYIDENLAGVIWPFPVIFTGGIAPGFWRPIVGTDAFDLRQPEIDISPWLPTFRDYQEHSFEIRVTGLSLMPDGTAILADTIGSYWVVTGNIFVYLDENDHHAMSRDIDGLVETQVRFAPPPMFKVTRSLGTNEYGGNDTLEYSVQAERTITMNSSQWSWTQSLSFSNHGLLNQQGYSQVNKQLTTGKSTITRLDRDQNSYETTFKYPLIVNSTYGITEDTLTIDAWMRRGLEINSSGNPEISTYTFTSGPCHLRTSQSGKAKYKSVTGSGSSSRGTTADEYESSTDGNFYSRSVRAVNGEVVYDTSPVSKASSVSFQNIGPFGRGSVRGLGFHRVFTASGWVDAVGYVLPTWLMGWFLVCCT